MIDKRLRFAIQINTSGDIFLFQGIRRLHKMDYPEFTPYRSHAKTWKRKAAADRCLKKLIVRYEAFLFPEYEHTELRVIELANES